MGGGLGPLTLSQVFLLILFLKTRVKDSFNYLGGVDAAARAARITTDLVAQVTFPKSGANANSAIRTLSRALSHAVDLGYLHRTAKLHLRRETCRKMVFTPQYEACLLAVAPQLLRDVFSILMDMGMCPEEVYRMRWEDVRWEENVYHVAFGKTDAAERDIGMSERVRAFLLQRQQEQKASRKHLGSRWVFLSRRDARKTDGHITTVNKAFARLGSRQSCRKPWYFIQSGTRSAAGSRSRAVPCAPSRSSLATRTSRCPRATRTCHRITSARRSSGSLVARS